MANLVQPLRPFMEFVLDNRQLTKEAYDFLYAMFLRVGGSLSNLNAAFLQNATWQEPNAIGVTTPNQGKFTTLEATDNIMVSTAGKGLQIKGGGSARLGTATMTAGGTVTVNNTTITANTRIFLTHQIPTGTLGFLRVSAKVNGVSFTISSSSATDTSNVAWLLVEET